MKVRPLELADIPVIESLHQSSNFSYALPDLQGPLCESAMVVVDDEDRIIAAAAAERILQLYLWVREDLGKTFNSNGINREDFGKTSGRLSPHAKLHAIRLLHSAMAEDLGPRGYREVNCFLPPAVERSFGRRLMKTFGWIRNWASYCKLIP